MEKLKCCCPLAATGGLVTVSLKANTKGNAKEQPDKKTEHGKTLG